MIEIIPGMTTPLQAAILFLAIMDRHQKQDGKKIGRFRISQKTVRAITGRSRVPEAFEREITEHLDNLGWAMIPDSGGYAFIRLRTVEEWPTLSPEPARDVIETVLSGDGEAVWSLISQFNRQGDFCLSGLPDSESAHNGASEVIATASV